MIGTETPRHAQAVTTHASNPVKTDGLPITELYVGGAGTVVCKFADSATDVTFSAVPVGATIRGAITHIRATSTATLMIAKW
jgi:hypothetical protein